MRTTLKKLLALTVCAVMILSTLVACGKPPVEVDETPETTRDYSAVSGVIVLNTGAIFSIRYDVSGNVSNITGDNDFGLVVMEDYKDFEGKAVTDVIKKLVELSAKEEALTEDISTVLVKIASGNVFDSEEKRNDLIKVAQDALTEAKSYAIPMIIDEENLTGEGYLTLATAKTLLMNKLGVDKFDAFYGDTLPINNYYLVTVELGNVQYSYTIDIYNGFISIASQEDLLGDTSEPDEFMEEETIEEEHTEFVEETLAGADVVDLTDPAV